MTTSSITIITPSYRPDLELFRDLRESIKRHAPSVHHQVIVPKRDRDLYKSIDDIEVITADSLLPRTLLRAPTSNYWLNARKPWLPVRGWIVQQIAKISLAARSESDHVLLLDSDVRLIRNPQDAQLNLVRRDEGVTINLPRHVIWHRKARELLDLAPEVTLPQPDFVSAVNVWKPSYAREMIQKVEAVTGQRWEQLVAGSRHFSEFILYGVYVELCRPEPESTIGRLAAEHWQETPLDSSSALAFGQSVQRHDLAIMISAKSHTPATARQIAADAAEMTLRSL